jgi:hypothetical protein
MPSKRIPQKNTSRKVELVAYAALILGVVALLFSISAFESPHYKVVYVNKTIVSNATTNATVKFVPSFNISSPLITPQFSLASDPIVTTNQSFGNRLTNINQPLNNTELSIINNAPNSYFEIAGEMYLNNTLNNPVGSHMGGWSTQKVPPFVVNGKPSVVYFGSITCIFCGENRWAMALALSRFGHFNALYKGYSSIGDSDVPTLYWSPAHYNQSTVDLGSFYNSSYINFIAIEDTDPISQGFNIQPSQTIGQEINQTGNLAYTDTFKYLMNQTQLDSTPYTVWGNNAVNGVDGVDFGNSTQTINGKLQLALMTHEQIFNQLSHPSDQFSWTEYAAADVYIAITCGSINNTASVCSLPAIQGIEKANGY